MMLENFIQNLFMIRRVVEKIERLITGMRIGVPSVADGALYLIALHMELYREGKILDKLSPECLEALYILKECDDKGRLTSTEF